MSRSRAAPSPATTKHAHGAGLAVELRDVFRVHRTDEGDAAALQGATLSVARGEHLCLLGPSGAGKSTLLRIVAGLEAPSAGVALVLDQDMGRAGARTRAAIRRRAIGVLDQRSESQLPPDLPIGQSVVLALALRGVDPPARRARARELLDAVGLQDRADARPNALSGGERQRVALCAALAHRPALLLADEPTGELDADAARAVRALIGELARAHGAALIVASHDPAMAEQADRAVRLRDGRIGEERRDGAEALVIGRGGWTRLPPRLLAQAGITSRATVHAADGEISLRPAAGPQDDDRDHGPQHGGPSAQAGHRPAELRCEGLCKSYGRGRQRREVIEGLSVNFAAGRFTVVTGRSGSGKSTLLALLAGLDLPDAGTILLDGIAVTDPDAERRAQIRRTSIGYLAQDAPLVPFLSAQDNVSMALTLRGEDPRAIHERVPAGLAGVGLSERAGQRVSRLSAGERQRVGLARAIASARGLLLVDEPTSRLDEAATVLAAEALAAAAGAGQTVVCATHEPILLVRADHQIALEG